MLQVVGTDIVDIYSSYTLLLLSHECHLFSKADQTLVQLCTATFVRLAVLLASGTCQLEVECNYISLSSCSAHC